MKKISTCCLVLLFLHIPDVFASADSVIVPIQRVRFHDRIREEQKLLDRADGKIDGLIKATPNADINLAITDAMTRRISQLTDSVELNPKLTTNNEKIRYLNYIENLIKNFRTDWKSKLFDPVYAPLLVQHFETIMKMNIDSTDMAAFIEKIPYPIGKINTDIFTDNKGYRESKKILFFKYATLYPDKILQNIEPFANEPFADSLIVKSCLLNPIGIYSAAQATHSIVGKLILRNNHPVVKTVVELSKLPNHALLYFPFLDDLVTGKKTTIDIKKHIDHPVIGYDSVGYYKLLVQTEIAYHKRLILQDTPVAMFGTNGLLYMLEAKAIQHFINPINELHEKPENIRMRAIEPLSPVDLYYMLIMGENDIYTSSYKHSFTRLIQRLGKNPRTDSLLLSVNFDHFRKFIKMAANFNKLDAFLALMPVDKSKALMKAFVANLDKTNNLEDAVDVADAYSSITSVPLQQAVLQHIKDNEQKSMDNNSERGKLIYGLLKTIFLSADSSKIDLTSLIGIPSIYSLENKELADDSGRIVQQVFFYGDDDGKLFFNNFMQSFSAKEWDIVSKKEWVEIKSRKGKKVWIYVNRPLDNDANLDDSAQVHLNRFLQVNNLQPSVVTHRGHSYWLPRTLKRMPDDVKIVVLGSCGGYKNLSQIIKSSPNAHIISTKEIGKGDINQPIANYLNQVFVSGKPLLWKTMWTDLNRFFATADPGSRESWEDYIAPYKNLGAIFIKAYNKKTQDSN